MEDYEMNHGMKVRRVGALVASMALLASAAAQAGGSPDRPRLDTNGDGSVDLAEIQAARPDFTVEKFNAADGNGDGLLSRDELRAAHGTAREHRNLDTDGDGSFSFEEMQKAHPDLTQEQYAAFDGDKDGKLTRTELKQGFGREMFARVDQDGSGGVSLSEMQSHRSGATQEDFAKLDTDSNGQLSPDELKAGHKKHRKQYGKAPQSQPNEG
jgi:Ca2+-binding EF-hand superfamily protein